ncbi:MAG TPA: hypothetical protein VL985_00320 [Stellaceae bacterium]|nr:hypothetical protein [Stellaceae bacterium]
MTVTELTRRAVLTLIEGLIASADPKQWENYCRLAAALSADGGAQAPVFAIGSVEWQRRQQEQRKSGKDAIEADKPAAGRRRLAQRGMAPGFAGIPSPFGSAGSGAFAEFIARHRGPAALCAEIEALEDQLVDAFAKAGRSGRLRVVGFYGAERMTVEADWFGHIRLDFANNRLILPDGSAIAGVEVTLGPASDTAGASRGAHERKAKTMLREALVVLWERGAFTAGTGNEPVLALVLKELGLSASNPPYGFKSAETIRKLRRELKMSL